MKGNERLFQRFGLLRWREKKKKGGKKVGREDGDTLFTPLQQERNLSQQVAMSEELLCNMIGSVYLLSSILVKRLEKLDQRHQKMIEKRDRKLSTLNVYKVPGRT